MAINSTSIVLFIAVCRYCNIKPLPYTVNASTLFLQIAQVQIKPVYTSYQSLGCTIVFSCIPLPHVCRYCWLSETGYLPDYPLLLPIKLVRPWLPVSPRQFVLPDMLVTALSSHQPRGPPSLSQPLHDSGSQGEQVFCGEILFHH